MRVVTKGYQQAPVKKISGAMILKKCRGHRKGCFHYDSRAETDNKNGVVTITFAAVIDVELTLAGAELEDVLKHENQHYADFKGLVSNLQTNMQRALGLRKEITGEAELGNWLAWFDYDYCVASANYHRRIGAPVEICLEPNTPRPR